MHLKMVPIRTPDGANVVIGHSHFIKTVEDLAEIVINTVPGGKYGLAFNEASGPCLVRVEGNDPALRQAATDAALALAAGHTFVLVVREMYPINVLDRIKASYEVCTVHCATANPVQVICAETDQGCGILGVIDGSRPHGVETDADAQARKAFLRKIGYKF